MVRSHSKLRQPRRSIKIILCSGKRKRGEWEEKKGREESGEVGAVVVSKDSRCLGIGVRNIRCAFLHKELRYFSFVVVEKKCVFF